MICANLSSSLWCQAFRRAERLEPSGRALSGVAFALQLQVGATCKHVKTSQKHGFGSHGLDLCLVDLCAAGLMSAMVLIDLLLLNPSMPYVAQGRPDEVGPDALAGLVISKMNRWCSGMVWNDDIIIDRIRIG